MCLGIPGKVVSTYRENDLFMARSISTASSSGSVWSMYPRSSRASPHRQVGECLGEPPPSGGGVSQLQEVAHD
jgi:hypothetical protein